MVKTTQEKNDEDCVDKIKQLKKRKKINRVHRN